MTLFKLGHLGIDTLLSLTRATLPSPKLALPPLKSLKEVKKDLSPITCPEYPLLKYYSLGFLALSAIKTTLHLGLSFLNHTCLTLDDELEERFKVLSLVVSFFPFLILKI